MIDLKELEEKLDIALTNETEETLTAWITYKRHASDRWKLLQRYLDFVDWLEENDYMEFDDTWHLFEVSQWENKL